MRNAYSLGFPTITGTILGVATNKDESILGSTFGFPRFLEATPRNPRLSWNSVLEGSTLKPMRGL